MPRRRTAVGLVLILLVAAGLALAASRVSLNALDAPGRAEIYLAAQAKHWIIGRAVREQAPPPPAKDASSVTLGGMQFRGSCSACHGLDGRTPSDVGRWMYPRASDLSSPAVQQWSDQELFWIIKHGIRHTGMPGFGRTTADSQIWHLVHYVRSLPVAAH